MQFTALPAGASAAGRRTSAPFPCSGAPPEDGGRDGADPFALLRLIAYVPVRSCSRSTMAGANPLAGLREALVLEQIIAPALSELSVKMADTLSIGSYPVSAQRDGAGIVISLEGESALEHLDH